jgi:hypothetical protein
LPFGPEEQHRACLPAEEAFHEVEHVGDEEDPDARFEQGPDDLLSPENSSVRSTATAISSAPSSLAIWTAA